MEQHYRFVAQGGGYRSRWRRYRGRIRMPSRTERLKLGEGYGIEVRTAKKQRGKTA